MGLVAEGPPERPQMSAAPENDFIAEAERMRNGPKHFMKVPGNLPPIGQMKHEKQSVLAQVIKVCRRRLDRYRTILYCIVLLCYGNYQKVPVPTKDHIWRLTSKSFFAVVNRPN